MPKPTVQNTPKPEPKRPMRPTAAVKAPRTSWDRPEVLSRVFPRLEEGFSLQKACALARAEPGGCPHAACVLGWVREDEVLSQQYARSRELGYALLGDQLLDIADEAIPITEAGATDSGAVAHQRLRIDTRKWQLSKMLPKLYGDKVTQEHVGAGGGPIQTTNLDLRGLSESELKQMELLLGKAAAGAQK